MVSRKPAAVLVLAAFMLILLAVTIPAAAQSDLPNTYTFASGATVSYPADWKFSEGIDTISLLSADTQVYVLEDGALRNMKVPRSAGENEALQLYYEKYHSDRPFKPAKVEVLDIPGRRAVQYDYSTADARGLIIAFRFSNNDLGLVEAISRAGQLKDTEIVLAIAESFVNGSGASTTVTVSNEPVNCTVSTDAADTVRVRVGPGENRASIVFLPANKDFTVLGKATANDDSLWWKLDKKAVAPNKSANEVWVADKDVKTEGNCDAVADVNAPPIIPISNVPPPPAGDGGSSGGNSGNQPSAGSVIPQSGLWTVVFGGGYQSCAAYPNDTLSYDPEVPPFTASISVTGGGSGFQYNEGDGNIPFGLISPNTYQGVISFQREDGTQASLAITVTATSGRQMSGVGNLQDNYAEMPCSATFSVTMTHN